MACYCELDRYVLLNERYDIMTSSRRRLLILLLIFGCIMILFLCSWFSRGTIINHLGWGWENNLPDHLNYHERSYALGISGCKTRTEIGQTQQIGTLPMLFGSSYPMFAAQNQVRSNGVVMLIFVEKNQSCYITYTLEGSP
jgi:hypothetical protein